MATCIGTYIFTIDAVQLVVWPQRKNSTDVEGVGNNTAKKGQKQTIRLVNNGGKYILAFDNRRVPDTARNDLREILKAIAEMDELELALWCVYDRCHTK